MGDLYSSPQELDKYLKAFTDSRELASKGCIAELIIPSLVDAFLALGPTRDRLQSVQKDATFWRNETDRVRQALRDEIAPLWYKIRRNPYTGSCIKIPAGVSAEGLLRVLAGSLDDMFASLGENLETKLKDVVNTVHMGILKTLFVEYQEPAESGSSDCWFVFQAGFCVASFPTQVAAEVFRTSLAQTLTETLTNQGAEAVDASMGGRPARYVDRWTGALPEEVQE